MMKYLCIDEEFNRELLRKVSTFFNELEKEDRVTIFLNSAGGDMSCLYGLCEIFTQNKERIKLVLNGGMESSAFILFYSVGCQREILPMTYGMAHLTNIMLQISANKRPYGDLNKFHYEDRPNDAKFLLDVFMSIGMSQEKIDEIEEGKDVFFSRKELLRFLEFQEEGIFKKPTLRIDRQKSFAAPFKEDDIEPHDRYCDCTDCLKKDF